MLVNTFTIVLGETLEAGVLGSLLFYSCHRLNITRKVLWLGLVFGALGAGLYGANLSEISNWFDYTGQEWVNALISIGVFLCLTVLAWQLIKNQRGSLLALFVCSVMIFVHEGSELYLFYASIQQANFWQVLLSGLVGLAVGTSLGVLIYYAILLSGAYQLQFAWLLVTLVGAGLLLQASQYLIQADALPAMEMLWNSEWLLSERSSIGQLLTATIRYESTPSLVEVVAYFAAWAVFLGIRLGATARA